MGSSEPFLPNPGSHSWKAEAFESNEETMATVPLTVDNFAEQVGKPGIVVIDLGASWCGPCRAFAPTFEAASLKHAGVTWAKVDTEAEPGLAQALQIQAIPTLMVFRDGVLLLRQPGAIPAAALDLIVKQVGALDMEAIRAEFVEENDAKLPERGDS